MCLTGGACLNTHPDYSPRLKGVFEQRNSSWRPASNAFLSSYTVSVFIAETNRTCYVWITAWTQFSSSCFKGKCTLAADSRWAHTLWKKKKHLSCTYYVVSVACWLILGLLYLFCVCLCVFIWKKKSLKKMKWWSNSFILFLGGVFLQWKTPNLPRSAIASFLFFFASSRPFCSVYYHHVEFMSWKTATCLSSWSILSLLR